MRILILLALFCLCSICRAVVNPQLDPIIFGLPPPTAESGLLFNATTSAGPTSMVFNCSELTQIALAEPALVEGANPPAISAMLKGSLPAASKFSQHQRLRKIYSAALTPDVVGGYLPVMETIIKGYFDIFYSSGQPTQLFSSFSAMIVDLATVLMLGPQLTQDELSTFRNFGLVIQAAVFTLPDEDPESVYQQGIIASNAVRALATPMVKNKIVEIRLTGKEAVPTLVGTSLLALKKQGVKLYTINYQDYVNMTPALYLMFLAPLLSAPTIWNLLDRPDFLEALRQEQAALLATSPKLGLSQLASLPYVDAAFKEQTTGGPVAGVGVAMFRRAKKDFMLGDKTVPKNNFIALENPVCLLQNPDGPDVTGAFSPDVWINNSTSGGCPFLKANPPGFIPFGVGVRQCPGRYLGSAIYRMTLSIALRGGTWTRVDNSTAFGPSTATVMFQSAPLAPASAPSPACPGMGWWPAQPPLKK